MGYPTAAQVLSGVVFGATNELTGTLVVPSASNVKAGVTFGAAGATTGTLEAADYSDLIQERRTSTTLIGSLIPDSDHGATRIGIYDNAAPNDRAIAWASAINGRWKDLLELPNGKTYRLVFKDHNNQIVKVTTITI